MRRSLVVMMLLLLLIGGGLVVAPAASASTSDVFILCEVVGNAAPPAEDDCFETQAFIGDTIDRQADNVFWVFCTVFPDHEACTA